MNRGQLAILVVSAIVIFIVGNGLLPLLPVYATQLGAAPALAGYYLAIRYAAATAGTMAAGWLADRAGASKGLLVGVGALAVPLTWLQGRVASVAQLIPLTATLWFMGGAALTLLSILAGRAARPDQRGRVFGLLSLANPVGLLLGGLIVGPVVDRGGYATLFGLLAGFWLIVPGLAWSLQDEQPIPPRAEGAPPAMGMAHLSPGYWLLLAASLCGMTANFVSQLGRSLSMQNLGFGATAISSTAVVSGVVMLLVALVVGPLSDRLGRKLILVLGDAGHGVALLVLAVATSLWQFWLALSLVGIQSIVYVAVGSAYVADVVPPASQDGGWPCTMRRCGWLRSSGSPLPATPCKPWAST